ncbi:MAG: hypothetical protein IPK69_03495 [Phycisphaerales bacterium]|nr:MAG: hypothetical protein IPK69_03495 [Phycisphaerales bacterium]
MAVLPSSIVDRLEWFEQRYQDWIDNSASVGLSPAQSDAVKQATVAARAAYNAAQAARIAAKNATIGQAAAMRTLSDLGADAIRYIRAFAESQPTQQQQDTVYQLASVPPPAPPTPAGPPEAPTDLVGDPNADGTVTLNWKGSTANQTFFTIWRRIGTSTTWTQVGAVASKTFIDATAPAGVASVRYTVRAQRNNQVSAQSVEAVVNFGISQAA